MRATSRANAMTGHVPGFGPNYFRLFAIWALHVLRPGLGSALNAFTVIGLVLIIEREQVIVTTRRDMVFGAAYARSVITHRYLLP
jgi:hypothetical protein